MDALCIVEDEVALEGLDGITLPSLWIRLEERQPKFSLKLDDGTKELIWRALIHNTDLKLYQLPKEREDVEVFDRFKEIDPETGIRTIQRFTDTRRDVYPVDIIQENKDGIQGSCAVFKQRTDVTKQVRSNSLTPLLNLQEALERYGRKLVVVASQQVRLRALIGSECDPDVKLTDDSYCILERVGRARWQGELQGDLHGCSFKIDARKFHYLRFSLVKYGLISMQSQVTRLFTGQQQHSIHLLLKRFHVSRRNKYDVLMEYLSKILQQAPGHIVTMMALRDQLNVNERTFRRVFQHMRTSKHVEFVLVPLEELDPSAGPCINKKGKKVQVRCLKLLKAYTGKGDDDDDDEDDDSGTKNKVPAEGRIMERDVLTQSYNHILASGTKGVPQRGVRFEMNVGKLESRMICRRLEKDGLIKGFMEDEGRQRTTKFISHKCVGVSDRLQLYAKEQERTALLCSSGARTSASAAPATPLAPAASSSAATEKTEEAGRPCDDGGADTQSTASGPDGDGGKTGGKSAAKRKTAGRKSSAKTKRTQPRIPTVPPTPAEREAPDGSQSTTSVTADSESDPRTEPSPVGEKGQSNPSTASPLPENEPVNLDDNSDTNKIELVKDMFKPKPPPAYTKSKRAIVRLETYRMLKRKNMIVDAVHSLKVIEGHFPLLKMINDEEKEEGVSAKCCRKTILRLVHNLSREGLLKVYKTTVIQDGITKKVEMIVHPSVLPTGEVVSRVIDQVRFKISSSYTAVRQAELKAREQERINAAKACMNLGPKRAVTKEEEFKPTTVRGLGKSFGFQPKMHRLRVIHNFLWYLTYGHPLRHNFDGPQVAGGSAADPNGSDPGSDPGSGRTDMGGGDEDRPGSTDTGKQRDAPAESPRSKLDSSTSADEEEGEPQDQSAPGHSQAKMKVYADEESWKRFVPPVRVHKEYGSGWAMLGDLLLCLPLSFFIQVVQINYKVDGLEEYLNDPIKQHHLVRTLPAKMKRQLLYRRKYIFSFNENLQKLAYMGLMQFGPLKKFEEKDQVFLYVRRTATIVDTTNAEPHYWLVSAPLDKPFERRQYTFNTMKDVENYWFDMMCVCLNTPLGVVRSKRGASEEERDPSFVHERSVFAGLAYLLKGSREVRDDGSVPGDGKGAGGLDSEFFGHLKRNWLWTNHLLANKTTPSGLAATENKIRLESLLNRSILRIALKDSGSVPNSFTAKWPLLTENVEVGVEPASRNQQVVGGKKQKRRKVRKEVVKVPRKKKKEAKPRPPAHDAADHQALKMMTRQRVYWSIQEDSLMMLCSVASHLLNRKVKKPFVAHHGVRDMLHAEFEISSDKTSLAVGRRTRYILKNPQTLLNYSICLAEVYQDKALMKVLEEKKPSNGDNLEECGKAFAEYASLLRQKFSPALLNATDTILPDTKRQLFSRYKVAAIDSGKRESYTDVIKSTEDIHSIVLENLIQSTLAMNNNQMKSTRSFQTFHMYSRYNQELLCQVFVRCRSRGLVNRRRVNQSFGPKQNRSLPILPMSYQLSQSYYKCFTWRFPHTLCTDAVRFLRTLLNNGTADHRPATLFYHETETRSGTGEESVERWGTAAQRRKKQKTTTSEANADSTEEGQSERDEQEGREKSTDAKEKSTEGAGESTGGGEKGTEGGEKVTRGGEKLTEGGEKVTGGGEKVTEGGEKVTEGREKVTEGREKVTEGGEKVTEGGEKVTEGREKVTEGGEKVTEGGEKVTEGGEKVTEGREKVTEGGEKVTEGGEKVTEGGEKVTEGGEKVTEGGEKVTEGGEKVTGGEEKMTEGGEMLIEANGNQTEGPDKTDDQKSAEDPPTARPHPSVTEQGEDHRPEEETPEAEAVLDATSPDPEVPDPDECEMMPFSMQSPGGAGVASLSLMSLGLLSVRLSIPKQMVVVDSTLVDNDVVKSMAALVEDDDEDDEEQCDGRKKLEVKAHQASHTNYLMMRGYCRPGIVRIRNLNINDNIVVESCHMRMQLRNTPVHHVFDVEDGPPLDLSRCGPSLLPPVLSRSVRLSSSGPSSLEQCEDCLVLRGYSPQDLQACAHIRSSLGPAQEKGLGVDELLQTHPHLQGPQCGRTRGLQQYMRDLEEEGQVVRVGSLGARWVLLQHADPWLLTVDTRQWSQSRFTSDNHPNIPFMRKRRWPEVQREAGAPPAKRPAVDGRQDQEEGSTGDMSAAEKEKEQPEEQTEGPSGDKVLDLEDEEEGGKKMEPEEKEQEQEEEEEKEENKTGPEDMETEETKREKRHEEAGPSNVNNEDNVSFISRPWRMVDGTLNRQVCKGMLEAVLGHVMSRPGLTQHTLVEHYKKVLQPMAVLDLVQALVDIGCLKKKTVARGPKPSLFGRPALHTGSDPEVDTEDPGRVFYEPTLSCCLRLSQVLPNERHWNAQT